MVALLTDFRRAFREHALDLLWRQWTTLGVAGHGRDWQGAPIDPEALLLASCTMARHDARLFDAMLEWMGVNGRYVNIQRLKRILGHESFTGGRVLQAVAAMTMDSASTAKWRLSASAPESGREPVPFFCLKNGRPMPLVGEPDATFLRYGLLRDRYEPRQVAGAFRPEPVANLLLRLRALIGVNARAEIMAFLSVNGRGSPRSVARHIYYTPATVTKTMNEMRDSGYLISRMEGRRRCHKLVPDAWRELLLGKTAPVWVVWPRLLSALEDLWVFLLERDLDGKSPLAQASALRRMAVGSFVEKLDMSIPDFAFGDVSTHPGEALIPFFTARVVETFDHLHRVAGSGTIAGRGAEAPATPR